MTDAALPSRSRKNGDRTGAAAGRLATTRRRFVEAAARSALIDAILRRRACDICEKTGLLAHVAPEGTCVDIGAGLGHMVERIAAHRPSVVCLGLDPNWGVAPAVASRLRHNAPGRARFCRGDGRALPVADGTMSTALVAFVLHHLSSTDQKAVLFEAARVLQPGGTLILLEDTPGSDADRQHIEAADRRLNFEGRNAVHCYLRPDEWRTRLELSGFAIRAAIPFTRVFPPASLRSVPHHAFVCTALPVSE
ncbi:MAG: class I SAM-dependent methyltransferase [Alphaproteobacteria bacterium]